MKSCIRSLVFLSIVSVVSRDCCSFKIANEAKQFAYLMKKATVRFSINLTVFESSVMSTGGGKVSKATLPGI